MQIRAINNKTNTSTLRLGKKINKFKHLFSQRLILKLPGANI